MLRILYACNILILVPVCWSLFLESSKSTLSVFDGLFAQEKGLLFLIGSFWLGILICSIGGLFFPYAFWSILLLQVIYKSTYLVSYILPAFLKQQPIPKGIAASFVLIVVIYPIILFQTLKTVWLS